MCAAVDMLASQQYFYGHSPPAGFLADYAPPMAALAPRRAPPARSRSAPTLPAPRTLRLDLASRAARPCLRRDAAPPPHKRVAFADDLGRSLEQVRVMPEPSHAPPYWLVRVSPAPAHADPPPAPAPPADRWECRFAQPASDYVEFRRRVTQDGVSLENVIVKEAEGALDGTVKVKNIDFGKEVLVRATCDGWRTHEDTYCAFSEAGPPQGPGGRSSYDTFAFRLQLPGHSRRLEFCVCFRCGGEERWDSNGGSNYAVERRSVRVASAPAACCGRLHSGNSWSARSEAAGVTPYW